MKPRSVRHTEPSSVQPRGRRVGTRIVMREPTGSAIVSAPKFDAIFADAIEILSLELKRMRQQVQAGKGLTDREARQFNGYLANIFKVLEDRRKLEERLEGMSDNEIEQLAKLYLQGKGTLSEPGSAQVEMQDVTPEKECP